MIKRIIHLTTFLPSSFLGSLARPAFSSGVQTSKSSGSPVSKPLSRRASIGLPRLGVSVAETSRSGRVPGPRCGMVDGILVLATVFAFCASTQARDDGYQKLDADAAKLADLGSNALARTGSTSSQPALDPSPPPTPTRTIAQPADPRRPAADAAVLLKKDFWIGSGDGGSWIFKFGQTDSVWVYSRNDNNEKYAGNYAVVSRSEVSVSLGPATNRYTLSEAGLTLESGIGPALLTNRRPDLDDLGRIGMSWMTAVQKRK